MVEDDVFIGPCAMTTNDDTMGRHDAGYELRGTTFRRACRVGGGAVLVPASRSARRRSSPPAPWSRKRRPPRAVVAGVPARRSARGPRRGPARALALAAAAESSIAGQAGPRRADFRSSVVPGPPNESARLAALYDLEILDTPSEELYDDVVRLAAAICDAPIAIINFVDADRQWGKALVGLDGSEAPREASFCARTIVAARRRAVVEDTPADPDWAGNAQVVGDPHLRFYAGAAILTDEGHALGTVCVADRAARTLSDEQLEGLRVLARQTSANLELRRQSKRLVEANAELRRLAIEDPLTGLANRTLVFDRLTQALGRRRRSDGLLGVLFCDLDSFKPINDRLGHQAGDDLLCIIAERLTPAGRVTDTVARLAGDEFVVVCPDLGEPEDLQRIARRVAEAVSVPARVGGMDVTPRMSIGTAIAELGDDAESLLAPRRRGDVRRQVERTHK